MDDPNTAGVQDYTVITDTNGFYHFINLTPGNYTVKIITPPTDKSG